ncbi:MAG TPA: tetratricopeptide repeat protein [Thermoanaerobaculia bacterium]|jgi:DNA-binding winged helix-turn-helix (wHTH) protein/tetratricopeptide (TPR) repeat protein|nr:tetratricopeptide repeat protein [Thermoanaerobaculia bacterium]
MPSRSDDRTCYEFDEFLVDPVRRLLLRGGEPVPVTPKALSILLALLEQPGEVVEKADLIEKVWAGSHVTEANLTQNVFALRKCLGDRANDSRYVVTVPGRGYVFAGEVRRSEPGDTGEFPLVSGLPAPAPPPSIPVETAQVAATAFPAPAAPVAPDSAPPPPVRTSRRLSLARWGTLVALGILGALLLGFFHVRHPRSRPAAAAAAPVIRQSVAMLDFRSLSPSGETRWLQSAFPEMLTTELAAGGTLRVLRGEAVAQVQRSLSFQKDGRLSRGDLERLHNVLGADLVVVGTYLPKDGKIHLDLQVLRAPESTLVTSLSEVGSEPELFDLVAQTGARLRGTLGVAALSPEQERQARKLQPANAEASRPYHEALLRLQAFDPPGALELLRQATEADPGSAVIHSALSRTWTAMGYDARAAAEARRAVELAGSLPREDRLAIQARLYQAGKQWDQAAETYRSLWTFFPDEIEYGLQLADNLTAGGHGAEAAATLAALRKLPPPEGQDPRLDLAEARNAFRLSDYATELRAAGVAAAKGRKSGQTLVVSEALLNQGIALVKMGRAQEGLALLREAEGLARKAGDQWHVGRSLASLAAALKALGDLDGAEKTDEEALAIARQLGSGVGTAYQLYALGELHRERGDLAESRRLLKESHEWYVKIDDRLMQTRVLNLLGEVLCAQGDLAGAREQFEGAQRIGQAMAHPAVEAESLDNLGNVLALQGDLAGARSRHEQAFAIFHRAGDSDLAASALTALADVEARQGDLDGAWQRSARALAAKRQAGDKVGVARILGSRARLAYDRGDLAASRSLGEDQLRLARETGARALAAGALRNLGRSALAAGDPDGARKSLQEALAISSALGGELQTTEIRLTLADLDLATGHPREAAALARQVASWCRSRKIEGGEALALTVLGEALLVQGLRAEAYQTAVAARSRLGASQDLELRLELAAPLAGLDAAGGHAGEALRDLRQALQNAERVGLVEPALEARLALGQIQRGMGDPAAEALLAAVRRDAETRGFRRLAALAASVLGGKKPPRSTPLG